MAFNALRWLQLQALQLFALIVGTILSVPIGLSLLVDFFTLKDFLKHDFYP